MSEDPSFQKAVSLVEGDPPLPFPTSVGCDQKGTAWVFYGEDGPFRIPSKYIWEEGFPLGTFLPTKSQPTHLHAWVTLERIPPWLRSREEGVGNVPHEGLFVHVYYSHETDWMLEEDRIVQTLPFLQGYRVINHAKISSASVLPIKDEDVRWAWLRRRQIEPARSHFCTRCGPKKEQPTNDSSELDLDVVPPTQAHVQSGATATIQLQVEVFVSGIPSEECMPDRIRNQTIEVVRRKLASSTHTVCVEVTGVTIRKTFRG